MFDALWGCEVPDVEIACMVDRNSVRIRKAFRNRRMGFRRSFQVFRNVIEAKIRHPEIARRVDRAKRWPLIPLVITRRGLV